MTHPPVRLPACCSGVAEMATHLWQDLEAFIARAPGDVHFAGHSLGGSLSLLLTVMSHLRLGMPGQRMTATTFGSPPVLSLRQGEDGDAILEVLGVVLGAGWGGCGHGWHSGVCGGWWCVRAGGEGGNRKSA